MNYEVVIYWSPEDNAFIAELPELSGCMADGAAKAKALAAVDRVAREWPAATTLLRRPIPVPRGRLVFA